MKTYIIEVKHKERPLVYSDVYLIENLKDYSEYLIELNGKFKLSEEEIKTKSYLDHMSSDLTRCAGLLYGDLRANFEEREPIICHLKLLQLEIIKNQLTYLLNGDKLVISKKGGYFHITKNQEFLILNVKEKEYTKKDIKISKWWGGKHYYAKIGNIDVSDEKGNCKWNTEQYAYYVAVNFLEKLNKEN